MALVIAAQLLVAVAILFDTNDRLTRVQTQVADMQQSLRVGQYDVVRFVRMAGRGGLPALIHPSPISGPNGLAVEVRNNVGLGATPPPQQVALGFLGSPLAVLGTDILTVRGCFESPLFQINFGDPTTFNRDLNGDGTFNDARIRIGNPSPQGLCQSLVDLNAAVGRPLLIVSPLDPTIFATARISGVFAASGTLADDCLTASPSSITLDLDFTNSLKDYRIFSSEYARARLLAYPPQLNSVSWACLLEEERFYIRQANAVPGDPASPLAPRLTRARMDPGQEQPFAASAANLQLDIADNILTLQVALGLDTDRGGAFDDDVDLTGADDSLLEGNDDAARATDDWLYNAAGDDPTWLGWRVQASGRLVKLQTVRLSAIARTDREDPSYRAPLLVNVEDQVFSGPPLNAQFNSDAARMFRRRSLQTIVDPRNL